MVEVLVNYFNAKVDLVSIYKHEIAYQAQWQNKKDDSTYCRLFLLIAHAILILQHKVKHHCNLFQIDDNYILI